MRYHVSRYYQVIMIIDIFQYSNMYTLRKSIQWLADEPHVKEECGPYVIKEGKVVYIPHPAALLLWSTVLARPHREVNPRLAKALSLILTYEAGKDGL
jgi:Nitrogen permease regulator 2